MGLNDILVYCGEFEETLNWSEIGSSDDQSIKSKKLGFSFNVWQ